MRSLKRSEAMKNAGQAPRPQRTPNEFIRLPGLFRRWELEQVVELGTDFHIEDAGTAADGTQLLAVYRRTQGDGAKDSR